MNYLKRITDIEQLFTLHGCRVTCGDITIHGNEVSFTDGAIECKSCFTEHESGVTERADVITNISAEDITLTAALTKFVFNGGEYEVYSQHSLWEDEVYGGWQPLMNDICGSSHEVRHAVGPSPFVAIYNLQTGRGVAFHIMANCTWKYRVCNYFSQQGQTKTVNVELGIDDKDFSYTLKPGESLELPVILYYEFTSRTDLDAYKLHRYCLEKYPQSRLPVMYNSWLSKFDKISFDSLAEQLKIAAKIGCEFFTVDAGWFGAPNQWFDSVGDWEESPLSAIGGRLLEFAELVRSYGLKFGLWFEIERASLKSRAFAEHPELYIVDRGNAFVNYAKPEACQFVLNTVSSLVEKYGIEFIKFDFNAPLTYDPQHKSFINYFKGYDSFIKELKRRHPDLYLENCASGGMRLAVCSLNGFDSFWASDNHSLYTQLEVFKKALIRMPSRAIEKWLTLSSHKLYQYNGGQVDKILTSGDAGWGHVEAVNESFLRAVSVGGPIGLSCDLTLLSPELIDILTDIISRHKSEAEFILGAECRMLTDTESMTVLQFSNRNCDKIKLIAFTNKPIQSAVTVYPVISGEADYTDGDGNAYTCRALISDGVELKVGKRMSSTELTLTRI